MRILLAITSSISAYKSPILVRELIKNGHSVICVLSKNASKLVSKKALETVSENPVITNMWRDRDPLKHISINKDTDVLLIAPATANIIGKIANGICDDSISTIAAAFKGKKFFAPAMNPEMWNNKAVQRNVDFMVNSMSYTLIEPEEGIVACKDIGRGRLASNENILSALKLSEKYTTAKFTVSSGATIEWIDTIRYITNNSSGKMGFALYGEIISNGGACNYVEGKVNMFKLVEENICRSAVIITDQASVYEGVLNKRDWRVVNHSKSEYVVNKHIYTNSIEGIFSLLKRSLYGIYHKVSSKHLQMYLNEISFRMNCKNLDNKTIFDIFMTNSIHG